MRAKACSLLRTLAFSPVALRMGSKTSVFITQCAASLDLDGPTNETPQTASRCWSLRVRFGRPDLLLQVQCECRSPGFSYRAAALLSMVPKLGFRSKTPFPPMPLPRWGAAYSIK